MKVIYVGSCNSMATVLVDRLVKEEDQVYIISKTDFISEVKPALKYKLYRYNADDLGLEKVFASVKPDLVIFAGEFYMSDRWEYNLQTNTYINGLLNILNLSNLHNVQKLIYLSTVEIYSTSAEVCLETSAKHPLTYKGQLCSCGEELVLDFTQNHNMNSVILRMDRIFGCSLIEEQQDFLTNLVEELSTKSELEVNCNHYFSPIHMKDCVDAIFRSKSISSTKIYNVCGPDVLQEAKIVKLLSTQLKMEDKVKEVKGPALSRNIDCSNIKKDLEWVCYHQIVNNLENHEINFQKTPSKDMIRNRQVPQRKVIITLENIIIFLFFLGLSLTLEKLELLNTINPMIIYIVIMALVFGTRQAVLSVFLATAAYWFSKNGIQDWNNLRVLISMEFIITVFQYIFLGVVIGYTIEHHRTMNREKDSDIEYLNNELKEIYEINDDNIKIKREYEKRILTNKTSLPKLYSIISRLTVLEPAKIFAEAIDVIKDIMDTDTVAVYLSSDSNSYMRLIASSTPEAVFQGKSVNMKQHLKMQEMLNQNELFIGSQWDESEPSLAAPIFHEGKCIAVIIINSMKFAGLNLYQVNLFRTLTILIAASVAKAKEYETAARSIQYIDDTEILNAKEFQKLIEIKREGKEKEIADYSILKFKIESNIKDTFDKAFNCSRNTDFFGTDEENQELFILLNNTSEDEIPFVQEKFRKASIETEVIKA